jgi:hypothetical protein
MSGRSWRDDLTDEDDDLGGEGGFTGEGEE